jgi:hypothetical protein
VVSSLVGAREEVSVVDMMPDIIGGIGVVGAVVSALVGVKEGACVGIMPDHASGDFGVMCAAINALVGARVGESIDITPVLLWLSPFIILGSSALFPTHRPLITKATVARISTAMNVYSVDQHSYQDCFIGGPRHLASSSPRTQSSTRINDFMAMPLDLSFEKFKLPEKKWCNNDFLYFVAVAGFRGRVQCREQP